MVLAVAYFPQLMISIHNVDIQFSVFYHLYLTHLGRLMDTDEDDRYLTHLGRLMDMDEDDRYLTHLGRLMDMDEDDRCKAMAIPYMEVQVRKK